MSVSVVLGDVVAERDEEEGEVSLERVELEFEREQRRTSGSLVLVLLPLLESEHVAPRTHRRRNLPKTVESTEAHQTGTKWGTRRKSVHRVLSFPST